MINYRVYPYRKNGHQRQTQFTYAYGVYLSLILTIISNKPNYFSHHDLRRRVTYTLYLNVEKPKDAVPETEEEIPEELEDIMRSTKALRKSSNVDNILETTIM